MTSDRSAFQSRPRLSRRRLLAGAGSSGTASLFLAACGGSGKSGTGAPAGQPSGAATPEATPVRGGTLKFANQTPIHFDPFITGSFSTHQARSFVSDKLITFAQGPDIPRGARVLKEQLAEKWESPDGLSWTFHMRPGMKFHNGRPVTAEDARWSFERGMDPKAFPIAILAESSLSFLGYGVVPPTPSWGAMLSGSSRVYTINNPWMSIWPGIAIAAVVFVFNTLGDSLRDILDPRLRQ